MKKYFIPLAIAVILIFCGMVPQTFSGSEKESEVRGIGFIAFYPQVIV